MEGLRQPSRRGRSDSVESTVREPPVSGDPVGAAKRARCERAGALRLLGDDSSAAGDAAAAAAARPAALSQQPAQRPPAAPAGAGRAPPRKPRPRRQGRGWGRKPSAAGASGSAAAAGAAVAAVAGESPAISPAAEPLFPARKRARRRGGARGDAQREVRAAASNGQDEVRVAHEVGRVLDSVLIDVEAEQLAAAIYQDQADYLEGLAACSAAACDCRRSVRSLARIKAGLRHDAIHDGVGIWWPANLPPPPRFAPCSCACCTRPLPGGLPSLGCTEDGCCWLVRIPLTSQGCAIGGIESSTIFEEGIGRYAAECGGRRWKSEESIYSVGFHCCFCDDVLSLVYDCRLLCRIWLIRRYKRNIGMRWQESDLAQ